MLPGPRNDRPLDGVGVHGATDAAGMTRVADIAVVSHPGSSTTRASDAGR